MHLHTSKLILLWALALQACVCASLMGCSPDDPPVVDADTDGDGVVDDADNCPELLNADQDDLDTCLLYTSRCV